MPGFPETGINLFYMSIYGGFGYDTGALCDTFRNLAAGISVPGNPPYAVNDLLAMYPKFFGPATGASVTLTQGVAVIPIANTVNLSIGQLVTGASIPSGAVITDVEANTSVTLSSPPSASGSATIMFYESPLVPLFVIQTYLNLAYASLMSSRWREAWKLAMGLYIAHFLTLYLQTDGNPQSTANQAVASGLQAGILTSQAADGVSMSVQPLAALDAWAAWTLTGYGVQLATMARAVGAGAVYFR